MTERQQPHWFGRFFASRLFLIVSFSAIALIAFGFARAYYQDYKVREQIRSLEEELDHLQKKKLESLEILSYVESQAFVEKEAVEKLNLKKPGETVIVLTSSSEAAETESSSTATMDLSNPVKWWYYLTHTPLPSGDLNS